MPRIAIVVGEASGDQLARGLINALRRRCPDAEFVGLTGPQMRAAGCQSWGDCQQLALMGLVEVISHLPRLRRLMRALRRRLRDDPPDVLIGIDAPDFNLRLEAYARKRGIPTVHYVCPSVWAWRQSRVKTVRRSCDLVLCLLPFEKDFLQQHAVRAEFVGHPLADEIGVAADRQACRHKLNVPAGPCLAILPGSRNSEINLLTPVFLATAQKLLGQLPQLSCHVAAASADIAARLRTLVAEAGLVSQVIVHEEATRAVVGAADAVLLASGTATLETMLLGRPMVVAYKANPITAWIGRRLVKIPYFSLPNLLAGEALVPEFLQEQARPEVLAAALHELLHATDHNAALLQRFAHLGAGLRRNASERAADAVLGLLDLQPAGSATEPSHD